MDQQTQPRNFGDILILLLLPAPLVGVGLILLLLLSIANPDDFSVDLTGQEEGAPAVATPTFSDQALQLATINAAPKRVPTAVPTLSSAEVADAATSLGYSPEMVERGLKNFLTTCAACHGADGRGVVGLGKTLLDSDFVHSLTDEELLQFVLTGRPIWDPLNTTGVDMPARGGNPAMTNEDILSIIAYLRVADGEAGSQAVADVGATPSEPSAALTPSESAAVATPSEPSTAVEPAATVDPALLAFTPVDVSAFLASLGVVLPDPLPQPAFDGATLFEMRCAGCHGADGTGVEFYGPNLTESELLKTQDAENLTLLLDYGRPIWDATNEAGVHMPAYGGYPLLSPEQSAVLVEYVLSLGQ
jgi:disulfide bond formation protein DsbB